MADPTEPVSKVAKNACVFCQYAKPALIPLLIVAVVVGIYYYRKNNQESK